MPEDLSGKLIVVEGLDGSGKSTQIHLLQRWLELENYRVYFTEWNSSPIVRKVTKRGKKAQLLTPTTFSLIHATDFADRFERQILPMLRAGYIVLADRYIYTAFARDVVRGVDRTWVRNLYRFACRPDIALFFKVPLEVALSRILEGRPQLKYYEAGMDMGFATDVDESFRIFQGHVYEEYLRMVDEFGLVSVDGTRSPEVQQREIREIVKERIDLPKFKYEWNFP
ncbi:MAG: dTMP kinase [Anaerolineales bacterium]|jgi:dTMP kinase